MQLTIWSGQGVNRDQKIRTSIINQYQIPYTRKIVGKDKIDTNHINVLIIPILSDFRDFKYANHKSLIERAVDKGIKVFLDYSWETVNVNNLEWYKSGKGDITDHVQHMKDHGVRIISGKEGLIGCRIEKNNCVNTLYPLVVRFDLFKYETRVSSVQMYRENRRWKLNTHYTSRKNKKYGFTALCGSVVKIQNALLFSGLHAYGLMTKKNYWTKLAFPRDWDIHGDWLIFEDKEWMVEEDIDLMGHLHKNKDIIFKQETFDSPHNHSFIPTHVERRIPQQYWDSHFSLTIETCRSSIFFTEKTYKPISIGLPSLIFGAIRQNEVFKDNYGYELYNEIWDYSFEREENKFNMHRYITEYIDQIKKTCSDLSVFNQPSVIEKAEHNRELFEKSTCRRKLVEDLYELFDGD